MTPQRDLLLRIGAVGGAFRWLVYRLGTDGPRDLASAAAKRTLVCPAGRIRAITPIIWQDHINRISGGPLDLTLKDVRAKLERKYFEFKPVQAFTLRDVWVVEGSMYHKRTHLHFRDQHVKRPGILPFGRLGDLDRAVLASTMMGMRWWGHWVLDDLPHQMLAEQFGPLVMHPRPLYYHETGLRAALNIQSPEHFRVMRCREMVVCENYAANPDRTRRYMEMRARLSHIPKGHQRVYIRRGDWGKRRILVNEDELIARLECYGFVVVNTKGRSAREILSQCKGAETVVGVEGSHLVLALLSMQHEGHLILLNPPSRVDTILADFGLFFGLRAGMFICQPANGSMSDFCAEPEELLRFIDYVGESLRAERGRMDIFLEDVLKQAGPGNGQ